MCIIPLSDFSAKRVPFGELENKCARWNQISNATKCSEWNATLWYSVCMKQKTRHLNLRVPVVLVEAAEREALRLNRSRSWVLMAWMERGSTAPDEVRIHQGSKGQVWLEGRQDKK
jgi:hypothetical protein